MRGLRGETFNATSRGGMMQTVTLGVRSPDAAMGAQKQAA